MRLSHAIICPFWKYFPISYIFAQIFKYFSLFRPVLNSMTASKWKSESPVSKTLLCWKQLGYDRCMSACKDSWNMLFLLIKLVSPFKLQNFDMRFSFIELLKSPKTKKFWYVLLYSYLWLRPSRWFDMKLLLALYEQLMNHFLFVKFTSTQIP